MRLCPKENKYRIEGFFYFGFQSPFRGCDGAERAVTDPEYETLVKYSATLKALLNIDDNIIIVSIHIVYICICICRICIFCFYYY